MEIKVPPADKESYFQGCPALNLSIYTKTLVLLPPVPTQSDNSNKGAMSKGKFVFPLYILNPHLEIVSLNGLVSQHLTLKDWYYLNFYDSPYILVINK